MRIGVLLVLLFASRAALPGSAGSEKEPSESPVTQAQTGYPYGSVQFECSTAGTPRHLTLPDAVLVALACDPRTRKAWAALAQNSAQLVIANSGYWPNISATLTTGFERNKIGVEGIPFDNTDADQKGYVGSLDLNWTVLDFGLRRSKSRAAHWALIQAAESQSAAVQSVVVDASQAFFNVLDGEAALRADREAEVYAGQSLESARQRQAAGAAALTDVLQAKTAYSAARVKRITAEGQLRDSLGALRVALGQDANANIDIDGTEAPIPSQSSLKSVDELIEEAKRKNPDLRAARATAEEAYANVDVARAQDMPTVALIASTREDVERNDSDRSFTGALSLPPNNTTRNRGIQLKLTIPLFSGFSYQAGIRAARAQATEDSADLQDTERQLTLKVWKASDAIRTETENYSAASEFLDDARQSYAAARARYGAGVGTILEMLRSQSDIASANDQRIEAASRWRIARLNLAAALGELH